MFSNFLEYLRSLARRRRIRKRLRGVVDSIHSPAAKIQHTREAVERLRAARSYTSSSRILLDLLSVSEASSLEGVDPTHFGSTQEEVQAFMSGSVYLRVLIEEVEKFEKGMSVDYTILFFLASYFKDAQVSGGHIDFGREGEQRRATLFYDLVRQWWPQNRSPSSIKKFLQDQGIDLDPV